MSIKDSHKQDKQAPSESSPQPAPAPTNQPPTLPQPVAKKINKKLWLIIGCAVLILIVAGLSMFLSTKLSAPNQSSSQPATNARLLNESRPYDLVINNFIDR